MKNATQSKKQLPADTVRPSLELFQVLINKFLENTEEFFTFYLEMTGKAWWVEIITKKPDCTYYFGPFASHREAQLSQLGYIEDLEQERPQLIAIEIMQCQPKELTIFSDEQMKDDSEETHFVLEACQREQINPLPALRAACSR